jgi:hypothetical protein
MKLTKGKLSKIRNKKNQSAKRIKKSGKGQGRNTKTFRKRKALNLHNKSLKKYKGGKTPESVAAKLPEKENKVVLKAKPEQETKPEENINHPVAVEPLHSTVSSEKVVPTSDVVEKNHMNPITVNPSLHVDEDAHVKPITEHSTSDVVKETHMKPIMDHPTSDVVEETHVKPIMDHPTSHVVEEMHAKPIMDHPTSDVVKETHVEPVAENPASHLDEKNRMKHMTEESIEPKEEIVEQNFGSETGSENGSEISSEDADSISEESVSENPVETSQEPPSQQPIGDNISIVAESLDKLAEYISDKIAKKLNLNPGGSSTELNRDSFNAVANANQALVEA